MWISIDGRSYALPVICNPITGKYESLPELNCYRKSRSFLGFDPIENQFKILAEAYPFCDERDHHQILTLGTENLSWRKIDIECPPYDRCVSEGICINGVLYYLADNVRDLPCVVVCFDVRSEEFKFVEAECFSDDDDATTKLINYKGKLGGINYKYVKSGGKFTLELCMWVLEEKQEWLKYVYTLSDDRIVVPCNLSVVGMIGTGEIVLATDYTCNPFDVFYYHPERNTLQSVEIHGYGANLIVAIEFLSL